MIEPVHTLQAVADMHGVCLRTIEYHAQRGLLRPSLRCGRKRLCTDDDIRAYRVRLQHAATIAHNKSQRSA